MSSPRQHHKLLLLFFVWTVPAFSMVWPWKHASHPRKEAAVSPVRVGPGTNMVHASAQFIYSGNVVGPVNQGRALLFNASDPAVHEMVDAMATGSVSVSDARRVCEAYVPGQEITIGPNGSLDFDFVPRADYFILVCSKVTFGGNSKPVWVSALMPLGIGSFTTDSIDLLDMPHHLDVVLDSYAHELNAAPVVGAVEAMKN